MGWQFIHFIFVLQFKVSERLSIDFFQVVRGFIRKGTTGEASGLPFVAGGLNCIIWLKYGLLIDDDVLKFVNTIGASLLVCYSLIFYNYTPNKSSALKQMIFAFGFFLTISFYVSRVRLFFFLCFFFFYVTSYSKTSVRFTSKNLSFLLISSGSV